MKDDTIYFRNLIILSILTFVALFFLSAKAVSNPMDTTRSDNKLIIQSERCLYEGNKLEYKYIAVLTIMSDNEMVSYSGGEFAYRDKDGRPMYTPEELWIYSIVESFKMNDGSTVFKLQAKNGAERTLQIWVTDERIWFRIFTDSRVVSYLNCKLVYVGD